MMRKIFAIICGARPIEGSSRSRTFGRAIKARPIASICCSPPERVPPACPTRSFRRGNSVKTRLRSSSISSLRSLRLNLPISRFSRTVIPGKIPRPSGTWEMPRSTRLCAGILLISTPSNVIDPLETGRRPEMVLRIVVLPAPLAPISVTISPWFTTTDTPLIASILP